MGEYGYAQGIVVDRVWDEVAVTVPRGDVIVLNATAAKVFDLFEGGCDEVQATQSLADSLDIDGSRASREVRRVMAALRRAGVLVPSDSPLTEDGLPEIRESPIVTRREFALGAFAAIVAAMKPGLGFADESPGEFGSWGNSGTSGRIWFDPLGRAVALPDKIEKVAPFGAFAHSVMETIAPEKIVHVTSWGLRGSIAKDAQELLDEAGGSEMCLCDLSLELERPDIILSIVPADSAVAMNEVATENEEGIPVVHIVAGPRDLGSLYRTLAKMLECERAAQIAVSMDGLLAYFDELRLDADSNMSVFLGCGELCLETRGDGTLFQSVCDLVGVSNAASSFGEGVVAEVDPERLLEAAPDVSVLCPVDRLGNRCIIPYALDLWENGPFAQMGRRFVEPLVPFGWLDRSPLIAYTVGALWLVDVAYEGLINVDSEIAYRQFWRDLFGIEVAGPFLTSLSEAPLADNVEDADLYDISNEEEPEDEFEPATIEVIESKTIAKAQARMSSGWGGGGGSGGGGYVPTPTPTAGSSYSRPVYPSLGKPYANKGTNFWYKIVVSGSFDIIAEAKGAYIKLYTTYNGAPMASYKAINTDSANRCFAQYGTVTYFIKIESRSGASVQHSLIVQQHQDTAIYSQMPDGEGLGAAWTPTDGGAVKSSVLHTFVWAMEPEHVSAMSVLFRDASKWDDLIHGVYEAGEYLGQEIAANAVAYNLPVSALSAAVWGLLTLCEPDWVSDAVSALCENAENGKGAILHRYVENYGNRYDVTTWDCSAEDFLCGPVGSIGEWGAAKAEEVGL